MLPNSRDISPDLIRILGALKLGPMAQTLPERLRQVRERQMDLRLRARVRRLVNDDATALSVGTDAVACQRGVREKVKIHDVGKRLERYVPAAVWALPNDRARCRRHGLLQFSELDHLAQSPSLVHDGYRVRDPGERSQHPVGKLNREALKPTVQSNLSVQTAFIVSLAASLAGRSSRQF